MKRSRLAFTIGVALTALGTVAGLFFSRGLERVVHETDLGAIPSPCMESGEPFQHRLRAGCVGAQDTPAGSVVYSVNEDHLRDAPRARILAQPVRVLVMGGAVVEGRWSSAPETFAADLAASAPGAYFINGGLDAAGPLLQAERLQELLPVYRPAGVLWFLSADDEREDLRSCASLEEPGSLRFKGDGYSAPAEDGRFLGGFSLARVFHRGPVERRRAELLASPGAARCAACSGISAFLAVAAKAGVPVKAFRLGASGERKFLQECFARGNYPLSEADLPPVDPEQYFWEGTPLLTPTGIYATVQGIAQEIEQWLTFVGAKAGKRQAPPRKSGRGSGSG